MSIDRGVAELLTAGELQESNSDSFSESGTGARPESPTGSDIQVANIPVDSIRPNPRQPRSMFDEDALEELTASISSVGLLQPILVRRHASEVVDESFELIAGERRWRSVQKLGWQTIPAVIRATNDVELLRDALIENLQRSALNPLEEALAFQELLEDLGCTKDDLASRIGRSRPYVSNTIRLLRLPENVRRRVAAGVLSQGHARALLGLPTQAAMDHLATRIVAEGLSVRTVEEIVAVGEASPKKQTRRPQREPDSRLEELAYAFGDHLDTRVKISMGKSKGRISIDFAGDDDLLRIMSVLSVPRS